MIKKTDNLLQPGLTCGKKSGGTEDGFEIKFRRLFESVDEGILMVDMESGKITDANSQIGCLLGYSRTDLIGREVYGLINFKEAGAARDVISELKYKWHARYDDITVTAKNGRSFDGKFTGDVYEADDKTIGQCNIRDISSRKRAEEKIRKLHDDIARSDRDLAQFAYFASHDLQEPLRTMTDFLTLFEKTYKGKFDIGADDFIKFASAASSRLNMLISNLLAYSQVNTSVKEFEATDFGSVFKDVRDNLKAAIQDANAEITHGPLPVLNADHTQMAQLFQNLICNALKFRRDRPVISISAARKGNEWLFSVTDNGIGLDMKYAESVFNSFQRLHSVKEYPGTGLGLAICKKIVERHGGRIWLDSKLGEGTVFYFTIPDSLPVGK